MIKILTIIQLNIYLNYIFVISYFHNFKLNNDNNNVINNVVIILILKVKKTQSKINAEVYAPPSKSYTHRAIIMASIATGKSMVYDPLLAEDTLSTLEAC
ncbi:MAG: hypothetical protein ACRC1M_06130, partial [Methanobacteriaceae archaeon]